MADITISNHGSIMLVTGTSDEGRAWIEQNLVNDETQRWGVAVVCEPRFVDAIVDGARGDGLEVA